MNLRNAGATLAACLVLAGASAACAAGTDTTTGALTATIIRPVVVSSGQGLQFGTIVRPTVGPGIVTLANDGTLSVTGTSAAAINGANASAASFTVSGEGGQAFSLSVPATITLANGAASGGSLLVTTTNDAGCAATCVLGGALGDTANGSMAFHVAGSFPISSTTPTGAYSGTINVSVTYD